MLQIVSEPPQRDLDLILAELRPALLDRIKDLAVRLFGEPNAGSRRKARWQWGNKGATYVYVHGSRKGMFGHWAPDWAGDALKAIQTTQHYDFIGAVKFACDFCSIAFYENGYGPAAPPPDPAIKAAREAEEAERRAKQEAASEADKAKRRNRAAKWWDTSEPIDGTVGETYLRQERGIARPAGGWPSVVRFHHAARALVFAGTDDAGSLKFVHMVFLTPDGQKISKAEAEARNLPGVKVTYGPMEGAYVRLPGSATGPLLLAEGPETGLSVWSACGYETRMSIGGLARHQPVAERVNVICRDDDAHQSPADKTLKRALAGWGAFDNRVATPWPVRRCDKSDFNDLIVQSGPDAVRERIAAAVNPPHTAIKRVSADEGRVILRKAIGGFFRLAPAWNAVYAETEASTKAALTETADLPDNPAVKRRMQRDISDTAKRRAAEAAGPPPVHGIKVDVGGAKTQIALEHLVPYVQTLRKRGDKSPVVIAIPEHVLGDQQVARLAAIPGGNRITAAVWRSRKAKIGDGSERRICADLDAVHDAEEAFADVQTAVCRKVMPGGEVRECVHHAGCPFQKQLKLKPDVWFVPHELLFGRRPAEIARPAIVVIDEAAWRCAIMDTEKLLLNTFVTESATIEGDAIASEELRFARQRLFQPLSDIEVGSKPQPLERQVVAPAILAETAAAGYALEWKRKREAEIWPGMPAKQRKAAVAAVVHNKLVSKLGRAWKAIGALVADDGPERSGWLALGVSKTNDGVSPAPLIKGRKEVHASWHVPTLMLDATFQPDMVRRFWPTLEMKADVRLTAPHQHIIQVVDRSYSKAQLGIQLLDDEGNKIEPTDITRGLRAVHAIIGREARRYAPGRVLAVLQKDAVDLLPDVGPMPCNVELGWHNAVAGKDGWGPGPGRDGVVLEIVAGRTAAKPAMVETMAEAVTGVAVDRIDGWYPKADAVREMADGSFRPAETDRHPDPVVEAIRWSIVEGQLVQIAGRARGVNRTSANPVDVLVMTNAPLPIPVERLISADDLAPSPQDLMMAAGGVAFSNPTDAAAAYPKLWATRKAAKHAFERASEPRLAPFLNKYPFIREWGQPPAEVTYQRAGAGCRRVTALVDLAIVPDPEPWLVERLKTTLAYFALTVPTHSASERPSETKTGAGGGVTISDQVTVSDQFSIWYPPPAPTEPWEPPAWLADVILGKLREAEQRRAGRGSG